MMSNFGTIKEIFAEKVSESYVSENKEGKELYKKFINILCENDILKTQFIVYKNLENSKNIKSEISANEFIKENINLLKSYKKEDILKENKKLENLLKESGIDLSKTPVKEIHESINYLIMEEKNFSTIEKLHEASDLIRCNLMLKETVIQDNQSNIKENVDVNKFLNIVVEKYNKKYSSLNEEEKRIVKVLRSNSNDEKVKLLNDLIKESIIVINKQLDENKDSLDVKEKLLETKDVVYRMEYNVETFSNDIYKLYELKNDLLG